MKLHYYERGDNTKPTVVFLHGSASDATVWLNELNLVASKGYHALALDLRGHGDTKNLVQPNTHFKMDLQTHIYDVVQTLKELIGDKPFTIVAHSFGGVIALELAKKYSEWVKKLVLVCLPVKLITPIRLFLELLLSKPLDFIQAHLDFFQSTSLRSRYKSSITTNAHVLREIFNHVKSWNSFNKTPRLRQKIYYAAGRFDFVSPSGLLYKLYERTPNANFELFKWSSHALMEDEPEKFRTWLMNILAD